MVLDSSCIIVNLNPVQSVGHKASKLKFVCPFGLKIESVSKFLSFFFFSIQSGCWRNATWIIFFWIWIGYIKQSLYGENTCTFCAYAVNFRDSYDVFWTFTTQSTFGTGTMYFEHFISALWYENAKLSTRYQKEKEKKK